MTPSKREISCSGIRSRRAFIDEFTFSIRLPLHSLWLTYLFIKMALPIFFNAITMISCKQIHNLEPPVWKVVDIIYGPPRIKFLFTLFNHECINIVRINYLNSSNINSCLFLLQVSCPIHHACLILYEDPFEVNVVKLWMISDT